MTRRKLIVAYEPVWAIGSGKTPSLADVQEVHGHLRARLTRLYGDRAVAMRILYGGSVKPANAAELLNLPDVDGGLIGGASLNAEEFWTIALLAASAAPAADRQILWGGLHARQAGQGRTADD